MANDLELPPVLLVLDFRARTAKRYAKIGPHLKETHLAALGDVGDDMAHRGTYEGRRTLDRYRVAGDSRV